MTDYDERFCILAPLVNKSDQAILNVKTHSDTLKEFLTAWKKQDWKMMAELSQITWLHYHSEPGETLKLWFENHPILTWTILDVKEISLTSVSVTVLAIFKGTKKRLGVMVIKESVPFTLNEEGAWGVNPLSVYKSLG